MIELKKNKIQAMKRAKSRNNASSAIEDGASISKEVTRYRLTVALKDAAL
jgi:hypothetical protein